MRAFDDDRSAPAASGLGSGTPDIAPAPPPASERSPIPARAGDPPRPMTLTGLLGAAGFAAAFEVPALPVRRVVGDARRVRRGDLFVATEEDSSLREQQLRDAVARGAVAVVCQEPPLLTPPVPVIEVEDARRAFALLADHRWGRPGRKLRLAGITGSAGKTTLAWLARAGLEAAEVNTGIISSIGHRSRAGNRPALETTPPPDRLQPLLHGMLEAGEQACVMEVSAEGLVDQRTDGLRFHVGVATTLTTGELELHGSFEDYLDAKADLFRALPHDAVALLCRDDPAWEIFRDETMARVVTYGLGDEADVRGRIVRLDARGVEIEVRTPLGSVRIESPLIGRHNARNIVGALALCLALGAPLVDAARGISQVIRVPGRLERIAAGAPFRVFVDRARTPAALEQVLAQLRPLTENRLWVVFGCDAERDPRLRPLMARAVERHADVAMVTSDEGNEENPLAVIRDVCRGFHQPKNALIEPDRRVAIHSVLERAEAGDVVLIAGRGDVAVRRVGNSLQPFDDRVEVMDHFARLPQP